ncbi:hypothetical protein KC19_VG185800 [Ceratodon purpureus]|uniref:Uncharacterized protein n=1 Tax=Ceratodon purpureus TaxID=3225 RepID=A0A8T0HRF0_CERPU|nr:hypothetical protein KC19_VG185800 [Ceratodon purpureus]
MRHVFPEHAGQFSKRTGEKIFRTDDSVGNNTSAGECVKLGDSRRVLVKMPGSRLKSASSCHQANELKNGDKKLLETVESVVVKNVEEGSGEGLKRSQQDGVNLQWGHKKRTRNNKVDAKISVEESSGAKNPILRPDRRVVRAEKVPPAQGKAPVVAPSLQLPLKSMNGGSRGDIRHAEGNGTAVTARNVDANIVPDSEANMARKSDLILQSLPQKSEKISGNHANTGALPTASARPDAHDQLEKSALSGRVDMELFQWPKFIISLSRKEKEDDFFAIKGCKLPIRPKKRLKHVEKTLHFISPGSWLCDVTRERYEVREKKSIKKKPRGLKAMGSADSDSD